MKDRIFLNDSQIKKILAKLKRLSTEERSAVAGILQQLKSSGVGHEEFHQEIYQLQKSYQISEDHAELVENTLFTDEV
ncbi:MAG: hypothetical protein Q8P82_01180 [bacterium]|nr:hypothetical protein [bacterium]